MNVKQASDLTKNDHWFRYWMPYQFVHFKDETHKHAYLPLNRNYKPLGVMSRDMVDYTDFRSHAVVFGQDPAGFPDIWIPGGGLYLYEDAPGSRLDYFARLERLVSRSIQMLEGETRPN